MIHCLCITGNPVLCPGRRQRMDQAKRSEKMRTSGQIRSTRLRTRNEADENTSDASIKLRLNLSAITILNESMMIQKNSPSKTYYIIVTTGPLIQLRCYLN